MRDAVSARRGARPRRLFGYATTQRCAEAIASLERSDELKPAVPAVTVALASLVAETNRR